MHWANPEYVKARELMRRIRDLALIPEFAPHLEQVIRVITHQISLATERGEPCGWKSGGWKKRSYSGYDVLHHRKVDYGNNAYTVLLLAMLESDVTDGLRTALNDLSTTFSTLRAGGTVTKEALSMKGDVIEIFMGVLRGERDPPFHTVHIVGDPTQLPALNQKFCQICQAVHFIDAHLRSGKIKYRDERISKLAPEAAKQWWTEHYPARNSAGFLLQLARTFDEV